MITQKSDRLEREGNDKLEQCILSTKHHDDDPPKKKKGESMVGCRKI